MPANLAARIKGLSEAEFRAAFGTEMQCRAVLEQLRWRKGFICPACGHDGRAWLGERQLYQCNRCKHQVSLTAGTIFHATKLPLTTWFLAIHLIVTAKNGISSIELGRRLGVKQTTAWAMKQKLMQVMQEREAKRPLQGRVELDDADLGGERRGKRGRGAAGKTPVVAAVETTAERRPKKLKLLPVKGFRQREVEKLARAHLLPGSNVVSDGLSCWGAVERAGCRHFPMVTGRRRAGHRSSGSTPRSAISRRRSPAPTASSARRTHRATSPASPGASTAASSSTACSYAWCTAPPVPSRYPTGCSSLDENAG